MEQSYNNSLSKLYCTVFGHNYFQTKQVTFHIREYTCKSCQKQVTTDVNGDLIDLTPKYREINSVLERIYNHRKMRYNRQASNQLSYS